MSNPLQDQDIQQLFETLQAALERSAEEASSGKEVRAAVACLRPLLSALKWAGEERHLQEALPHFDQIDGIESLRTVLAHLNYDTQPREMRLSELTPALLPCLFWGQDGERFVVLSVEEDGSLLVFDALKEDYAFEPADARKGQAYLISPRDLEQEREQLQKSGWMQLLFWKFRRTIAVLLVQSFFINLLALSVPVYIMFVYGKAIAAGSFATLSSLFSGILLAIALELMLRQYRSRTVAYLGARVESLVFLRAFQQLLYLPLSLTETATISAQLTRLKQFGAIREVFSGSLANAFLDLPFIFVFVGVTFLLGGVLGFIPLGLLVIYGIMAAVTVPMARRHLRLAGGAKSRSQSFLMEMTAKHRSIRDAAAEDVWLGRFNRLLGEHMTRQFEAQQFNMTVQTLAQSLVMVAGAATVGVGTLLVLSGRLEIAALIATTALVWRGLAPLQSAFLGLSRIGQAIESFRQVNQLMRLPLERQPGHHQTLYRKFYGEITLQGVSLRYRGRTEAALQGITLKVPAGQIVAITGPSGAGKSTLLKVIAGLYQPQAGAIFVDSLDIRQLDLGELRQAIGYVPQRQDFFYGTIAQNLRLAHPTATLADMRQALAEAALLDEVENLPNGLETRLLGARETRFSAGFLKQLSLARAFVKQAPIYLLDEPGTNLDEASDQALMHKLESLRGKATVIMVTHRPSHMRLADRVVVLSSGRLAADGPPEDIVPKLLAAFGEGQRQQSAA